jgi:hypothetical protein
MSLKGRSRGNAVTSKVERYFSALLPWKSALAKREVHVLTLPPESSNNS